MCIRTKEREREKVGYFKLSYDDEGWVVVVVLLVAVVMTKLTMVLLCLNFHSDGATVHFFPEESKLFQNDRKSFARFQSVRNGLTVVHNCS